MSARDKAGARAWATAIGPTITVSTAAMPAVSGGRRDGPARTTALSVTALPRTHAYHRNRSGAYGRGSMGGSAPSTSADTSVAVPNDMPMPA